MRARIMIIMVAACGLIIGGLGAGSAQAVSDNNISQNTVHSTAYRVGSGGSMRFYGNLQAKPGPNGENVCYEMQQKLPAGNWTTEGFFIGIYDTDPVRMCSDWADSLPTNPGYISWSIHYGTNEVFFVALWPPADGP